jgi:predicted MPP superfamily phosphohydrolase
MLESTHSFASPRLNDHLSLPAINRRKFIQLAAAGGLGVLGVDSFLFEPNRPRVVRQDIGLRRWPQRLDGFTIALLSDFHYDPVFSVHPINSAVAIVNGLGPDLIVFTGDYVTEPWFGPSARGARHAEPCAQVLRQMQARHGSWAILGNHDVTTDPRRVTAALRDAGIQVLLNQSAPIERDGARFWLGGLNDVAERKCDLSATLRPVPPDEPIVLLSHEPDYADYVARHAVDLQLSGHSHGGQIRIPFVPPLYLPSLAKKYIWGLYQIRDLTLYTNPGLGTIGIPARLNCPPEITLLTIRRYPA